MKARWLLIAVISTFAYGQGVFYSSNATQSASNVPPGAAGPIYTVPNALVTVCSYPAVGDPCTNKVDIFTDQDLAPEHKITQPLQADSLGRYQFWVAPGIYSQSVQTQSGVSKGTYPLSLDSPPGPQGPPGIGCGAGFSQCIVETPTTDQTITQPPGTTLTVNNLNSVLNPLVFAGADLGAKVNAAFASCSGGCTVVIPSGTYTYSTGIKMGVGKVLKGAGRQNTILNYTGTGDAILWTTPTFSVLDYAGSISDFTLVGTSAAANGIHVAGINGPVLHDLTIESFCCTTGQVGLLLDDIMNSSGQQTWMERTQIHNVNLGWPTKESLTSLEFRNSGGTGSFDYSDISVTMSVYGGGGGTGILVGTGTDLFQIQLNAQGNMELGSGSGTTEMLAVKGNLRYSRGFIGFEGAASTKAIHVYSTGVVTFSGNIHTYPVMVPVIDAGGFYQAGTTVDFNYGSAAANGLDTFYPYVQSAAKVISADGTVQLARWVSGIYDIYWPDINSTFQDVTVSVNCTFNDPNKCQITTLNNQNRSCCGNVINNIRVMGGGTGDQVIPRLVADIGNRNGNTQTLYVTHIGGSGSQLFPDDVLGPDVISEEGLTVHNAGSSLSDGITWGSSSHDIIQSSDKVIWTNDGAPAAGACTPTNSINVFYNGQSIRIPTC